MKGLTRKATPESFAEAMARCQYPGATCGQDGWCRYGDCAKQSKEAPAPRAHGEKEGGAGT
jgi:hypothetical protein